MWLWVSSPCTPGVPSLTIVLPIIVDYYPPFLLVKALTQLAMWHLAHLFTVAVALLLQLPLSVDLHLLQAQDLQALVTEGSKGETGSQCEAGRLLRLSLSIKHCQQQSWRADAAQLVLTIIANNKVGYPANNTRNHTD
jgi:hypothetical protein